MNVRIPRSAAGLLVLVFLAAAGPAGAGDTRSAEPASAPTPTTRGADVPVVDEMPAPVKTVAPTYPESARQRRQEGTVYVRALVLKSGKLTRVKVAEGKGVAPDLDKAALEAVRQWVFTPAKSNGKPVDCWLVIPVAFRLQ